jgi:hypothetical protein
MTKDIPTILGREFTSTTTSKFIDGSWEVVSTMIERRTKDGENWEAKEINAKCTDDSFTAAYKVAIDSVLRQFADILNKTGVRSLFEDEKREDLQTG